MGKLTGMALAAAIALGIAVPAQAGNGVPQPVELRGGMEQGGRAEVDVSYVKRDGELYRKYRYRFSGITVHCDGQRHKAADPIGGSETIWDKYADRNPFGVDTISGPFNDPDYKSSIRGHLDKPTRAHGWVRVSGHDVSLKGGGQGECNSGRLRWVVRD